ncbi:MAG: hypothetical protein DMF37_10910 [Verrucomicrobia bacterium]|nr:MAG: hypothetical protein DMF37_10910 [Verrucomicrobiota bacterium]
METISELKSKAAELRKIADKLDEAASALAGLAGHEESWPLPLGSATSELGDLAKMSGVNAIFRVLTEAGTHLKKTTLSQRLRDRGKAIGDNTLQSYLSRDKRFQSYGRGRWGLAR